jgi:hypothetical protein
MVEITFIDPCIIGAVAPAQGAGQGAAEMKKNLEEKEKRKAQVPDWEEPKAVRCMLCMA